MRGVWAHTHTEVQPPKGARVRWLSLGTLGPQTEWRQVPGAFAAKPTRIALHGRRKGCCMPVPEYQDVLRKAQNGLGAAPNPGAESPPLCAGAVGLSQVVNLLNSRCALAILTIPLPVPALVASHHILTPLT